MEVWEVRHLIVMHIRLGEVAFEKKYHLDREVDAVCLEYAELGTEKNYDIESIQKCVFASTAHKKLVPP